MVCGSAKDVEEKHTYDNQALDDGGVKAKTLNWGGVGWKAPKAQKAPEVQLELIYGQGRGLMELARLMLAFRGKFPGKDYIDGRYGADKSKIENRLSANLGRMPCLWVKSTASGLSTSSQAIGSTTSIYYYIAYHCNLLGTNPIETAQVFGIHEAIKDLKKAQNAFMGKETDEASLDAWFEIGHTNQGATDRSPANADPEQRNNRRCRWYMERLETIVGQNYAVGNGPSMADLALFYHFRESVSEEQGPKMTKYQREPMSSKQRCDDALLRCPKIKAICDNVEKNVNIQKWLKTRGIQNF